MRLPPLRKVLKESLKGSPDWINPVIESLNSFQEWVYQMFNKNLTFADNFQAFIKELTYTTNSSYPGTPNGDVRISTELKVKASGLILLQAVEKTTYIPAAGPVYVPWVEDNGYIVIGSIEGLEASKTYIIRLLII